MDSGEGEEYTTVTAEVPNGGDRRWHEKPNSSRDNLLNEEDGPPPTAKSQKRRTFNWLFFKRSWRVSRLIFPRFACRATLYLILIILGSVCEELIVYQVGMIPSKYFTVFGNQDISAFTSLTLIALAVVSAVAIVKALKEWFGGRFGVAARANVVQQLHTKVFSGLRHYLLVRYDVLADNLDQRLTTDADQFCTLYGELLSQSTVLPLLIIYYSYDCFMVTGWLGPVSVYIYFVIGAIANKIFMGFLSDWIYRLERREGDFRYHHAQLRTQSESIAFYRGGVVENKAADACLSKVIHAQTTMVNRTYLVHSCNYWFSYFGSILSYIIVALPIFGTTFEDPTAISSLISRYSFVTMYLINCFSRLFDLSEKLARFSGFAHRLGELIEVADDIDDSDPPAHVTLRGEPLIDIQDITYQNPGASRPLCADLNLALTKGRNTLVVGPSGCGKSSLLRVISGLWTPLSGRVSVGSSWPLYVLPQKPYLLQSGTLRDQVLYPDIVADSDEHIEECLIQAGLGDVLARVGGIDASLDSWGTMLSPGEAQRVAFARLFCRAPPFAALDEATSSLDERAEEALYAGCAHRGITVLSVGHRSSLKKFHQQVLHLKGQGGWSVTNE